MINDQNMKQGAYDMRLSVTEAAKLFGVDQITVRRAIKERRLLYIVVRGRYKISFESLLKWSQQRTSVKNKLSKKRNRPICG